MMGLGGLAGRRRRRRPDRKDLTLRRRSAANRHGTTPTCETVTQTDATVTPGGRCINGNSSSNMERRRAKSDCRAHLEVRRSARKWLACSRTPAAPKKSRQAALRSSYSSYAAVTENGRPRRGNGPPLHAKQTEPETVPMRNQFDALNVCERLEPYAGPPCARSRDAEAESSTSSSSRTYADAILASPGRTTPAPGPR
jgi:hypothetical protein